MAILGLDTTREGQSTLIADARPVVEGDGLPALGEGIVQQEGVLITLCIGVAYARTEPDIQAPRRGQSSMKLRPRPSLALWKFIR